MSGTMGALLGGVVGTALIYVTGRPWSRCSRTDARRPLSSRIGIAGPGFAVASAVTFAALMRHATDAVTFAGLAITGTLFLLIALLDLRYQIVPNRIIYPAAIVAIAARWAVFGAADALRALVAGLGAFGLFFLAAWLSPGGLGGGDIKLAGLIGFVVSAPGVFVALLVAVLAGGLTAIALVLTGRRTPFPYAPFLCLGTLVALIWDPLPQLLIFAQTLGG